MIFRHFVIVYLKDFSSSHAYLATFENRNLIRKFERNLWRQQIIWINHKYECLLFRNAHLNYKQTVWAEITSKSVRDINENKYCKDNISIYQYRNITVLSVLSVHLATTACTMTNNVRRRHLCDVMFSIEMLVSGT